MPVFGADPVADADNGWSPVLAVANDSARRVLKVVDWTGGEGTKPTINVYVGASGLTAVLADAVDIRGTTGATGTTGTAGTDGATWTYGSGVPSNGDGSDGDFYFRTSTGAVYNKSSG